MPDFPQIDSFKNPFEKQGNVSQNPAPALPKACWTSAFTAVRMGTSAAGGWAIRVQAGDSVGSTDSPRTVQAGRDARKGRFVGTAR